MVHLVVVDERAIGVVSVEVHVVVEIERVRLASAESAYGLAIVKPHRKKSVKRVDRISMIGKFQIVLRCKRKTYKECVCGQKRTGCRIYAISWVERAC